MPVIDFPFGKEKLSLDIPSHRLTGVLESSLHAYTPAASEEALVRAAMEKPIGSPRLMELARGKNKIVILASDHTRPVPSKVIIPFMLEEIRRGNPSADVTILIATGCHRGTTKEELIAKFGEEIVRREKIYIHDCDETEKYVNIGTLPSGGECVINELAAKADLLVAEGFIEPHFFAGYSGGRKSVLPGVCSRSTVLANHCAEFIHSEYARTGIIENNPIHKDMVVAARTVNVQFILNVALDAEKKVIAAFAGDLEEAHEKGVEFIRSLSQCETIHGDIVVTSNGGYPLDQNLYQSPKGASTAEVYAGDDGVIIMVCSCCDGMGGTNFERLITLGTPEEIDEYLSKIPADQTIAEQWCPQIYSRILKKHKLILVTTFLDPELVKKANMIPAKTPDEALEIAYQIKGRDAKVVVVPDGVSVLAV